MGRLTDTLRQQFAQAGDVGDAAAGLAHQDRRQRPQMTGEFLFQGRKLFPIERRPGHGGHDRTQGNGVIPHPATFVAHDYRI